MNNKLPCVISLANRLLKHRHIRCANLIFMNDAVTIRAHWHEVPESGFYCFVFIIIFVLIDWFDMVYLNATF